MEEEQQGCFSPVVAGSVVGMGCIMSLVMVLLISIFLIVTMVALA